MIAGIILDDWKLPIFKKEFDKQGYSYTETKGPSRHCSTLKVDFDTLEKLKPVIEKLNKKCAN